ncbi:phosphoenolpyruvate--protein phosphotransferase [Stella humosa]|uniref:Phosphoenolpyruvate-protein phosphotransferase n=1 Tax=Stella humosa TaxID=94 RepID=A0A3N1KZQ5_9PROT|nr:phosphoenolpyruvate--protein phosphotransferase [Stella humosa]ROP84140.1 phosphoenolpyruvate--protein phosphotransferase [Stella humosa]BBK33650.1 phosphoenolpyruvate-protein phosphotransferase [Stella humosa]
MKTDRAERTLTGLPVSPGIAIGPVYLHDPGIVAVTAYSIPTAELEHERLRFHRSVDAALLQIDKLRARAEMLPESAQEAAVALLEVHRQMLSGSRLVRGVDRRIRENRINAEAALETELAAIVESFSAIADPTIRSRVDDVRGAGHRVLRHLTQTAYHSFARVPTGSVVLAEELTPADAALMDPARILGFAAAVGGVEGHTAIMARALHLPAVLGVRGLLDAAAGASIVVVDGVDGQVVFDPGPDTLAAFRRRRAALARQRRRLVAVAALPAITDDGVAISLNANIDLPAEVDEARALGADGVGLLRTEIQFMNREDLPDEDAQYEMLRAVVEGLDGRTVTIRTLDIGGDKRAPALAAHFPEGPNPALGLRAIRYSLKVPRLFETQVAAILRAGAHGSIRILLPMLTSVGEMRQARNIIQRTARRLRRQGVAIADPLPPIGAMIETPAAALGADALADHSDFFAIGTNDLTMYTLAIDRSDEQVASLYNPFHPAVLRLIVFAVTAARERGIPISVCGEIAGDPRYTALLLGLGLRELSMSPGSLPRVKERLRAVDVAEAQTLAARSVAAHDAAHVMVLVEHFNASL